MNYKIILAFLIFVLLDFYAFQSFKGIGRSMSPEVRRIIFGGYWAFSVIAYPLAIAMMFNLITESNQFLTVYGRTFLMILFIGKLLALPLLLIDDIRRGILTIINYFYVEQNFSQSRSQFLSGMSVLIGAAPIALLTYGVVRNPYRYKVRRHDVFIENLHPGLEGYKIVQISDIHSGSFVFRDPIKNGIEIINKEAANLVVFTGDIVNYKADEMDSLKDIFSGIRSGSGQPVYSVLGNHDYGTYYKWSSREELNENFERTLAIHKDMGWRLMMNEHEVISHNGAKLGVIGIENFSALPQFPKHGDLKKAVEGMEEVDAQILLSHDPTHWDYEVNKEFKKIDLTLSGHTHGFQFGFEIPGWMRWSPSQMVYKQWAGMYQKDKQYLYVNRGFGFLGYAGRVGILPEITVLTLTAKKPVV